MRNYLLTELSHKFRLPLEALAQRCYLGILGLRCLLYEEKRPRCPRCGAHIQCVMCLTPVAVFLVGVRGSLVQALLLWSDVFGDDSFIIRNSLSCYVIRFLVGNMSGSTSFLLPFPS